MTTFANTGDLNICFTPFCTKFATTQHHLIKYFSLVLNITDDQLTTWRYLAAKGMQSLFTDLEGDRRVEISRLNAGTLLADIVTK